MVNVKQGTLQKIKTNGIKKSKIEKINKKVKAKKLSVSNVPTKLETVSIKPEKQAVIVEEVKKEASPKKTGKYVMPTQSITADVVDNCLNALLNVIVNHDKKKSAIFDDEKPIFAEIRCIKIQNTRGNVRL